MQIFINLFCFHSKESNEKQPNLYRTGIVLQLSDNTAWVPVNSITSS